MINNIRAYFQRNRDFRTMLRNGFFRLNDSDPRPVSLLLGSLQFAGGWYLFVPFARFLPPFTKLFEAFPAWVWAVYFIVAGLMGMMSSLFPDGLHYLQARFSIAVWMFFNWFFLTATSLLTAMWILNEGKGSVNYGIALAFFPCLAIASLWSARRVRQVLADETAEEFEQDQHIGELKKAVGKREKRLKEAASMSEV